MSPLPLALVCVALLAAPALAEDVGGADLTAPPAPNGEALPSSLTGTLAKAKASGAITLGYRDASFPFSYLREGQPQGYSLDLCKGVVEEIGRELQTPLKIAYALVTSADRIDAVVSGKVDLECGSTTENLERRKQVNFSPLIFIAGTKLMIPSGSPVRTLRDLKSKTLVVTAGTTNEAALRAMNDKYALDLTIVAAPDHEQSYQMLGDGKADAFATDDVLLNGLILSHHSQGSMQVVGDYLTYEPYGLMFRRDDPEMAGAVRRAFAAMAADGGLVATYGRWFSGTTPTGERVDMPMSVQLTEAFRAMGAQAF